MTMPRVSRRTFLRTTVASAAMLGFPRPLRAQAKTFKIGTNIDTAIVLRRPMRSARWPPSIEAMMCPPPYVPAASPACVIE